VARVARVARIDELLARTPEEAHRDHLDRERGQALARPDAAIGAGGGEVTAERGVRTARSAARCRFRRPGLARSAGRGGR
jgi:hypothetical protein